MAADDGGDPRSGAAGPVLGDVGATGRARSRRSPTPRRAAPTSWCCRSSRRRATASRTPRRRAPRPSRCPGRRPMPGRPSRPRRAPSWWAASASSTGRRVRNTAVVVGPDGLLARYRKLHLWGRETELFTTGDARRPSSTRPPGGSASASATTSGSPSTRARWRSPARRSSRSRATSRTRRAQQGLPHLDVVTAARHRARQPRPPRGRRSLRHRARPPLARSRAGRRRRGHAPGHRRPTTTGRRRRLPRSTAPRPRDKRWGEWNDVLADRRPGLYGSRRLLAAGACRIGNRRCRTASSLARRRRVVQPSCALSRSVAVW